MVTAINESRDHVIASINEYVAGRFATMTIKMDVILAKVSALDKMIMRSACLDAYTKPQVEETKKGIKS
ncbi:hypothetical protein TSUD_41580 [Trifolium subterraneum]|nr:hypothetical protein TSUD_41580 [Trifolium subterraneum]